MSDCHNRVVKFPIGIIQSALTVLDEFNKLDLKDMNLYENGKKIELSPQMLDEWRFIGLSNSSFIDMRYWEEYKECGPFIKCVHTEHCCLRHGCKYGDEDCPVELNIKKQSYPCEECEINQERYFNEG